MSDVVFGAAIGYHPDRLRPFMRSLRATGYGGAVAFVVYPGAQAAALRADPEFNDVLLIEAPGAEFRARLAKNPLKHLVLIGLALKDAWLALAGAGRARRDALLLRRMHIVYTRHFYAHALLQAHPEFSRVLLTDVQDVFFQSNPFDHIASGLYLGLENPKLRIGKRRIQRKMMRRYFGGAVLNKLEDQRVCCAGVTAGDRAAVLDYLERMMALARARAYTISRAERGDQALHNYLLWMQPRGGERLLEPFDPLMTHITGFKEDALRLEGRTVLGPNGVASAILHRYNTRPWIQDALFARVGLAAQPAGADNAEAESLG